jgi:UDP-glucose 4-epimerase
MPTNAQTILVTGGAGFIGSHMVLALQQAGYTVVVLDNLSKGHADVLGNTPFILGDLRDQVLLDSLFQQYHFSAVIHFAGLIEVAESFLFPLNYYANNVSGSINLLNAMLKHEVNTLIFSSSAAVYGEPQSIPITEEHRLLPLSPYGKSKWMVETLIRDAAESGQLHYAILRYFNAAGADPHGRLFERHAPETHLIPLLIDSALGQGKPINIFGNDYPTKDGTCIRDYVHVSDLCAAHLLALSALLQGEQSMICNLGSAHGYSVREIIETVERVTDCDISQSINARRRGDPAILLADASLAKQRLSWQPQYHLEDMVKHAALKYAAKTVDEILE